MLKFVAHSRSVISIAMKYGWFPGARYTNLRDVRDFDRIGFLDIDWKNYSFNRHLEAVKATNPIMTVAQDILSIDNVNKVLFEAEILSEYSDHVIIVPKDPRLSEVMEELIPSNFLFGFSVPSNYGYTYICPNYFKRQVHLLGGRPDIQRMYADKMNVVSFDCNRFTLDATYGDYFDGISFKPHPKGGYKTCIEDSIRNINKLWQSYITDKECQYELANSRT
jgi:hypothetical protein